MNYATPAQLNTLWRMMREHFGAAEIELGYWQYLGQHDDGGHCFRKRAGMPTLDGGTEPDNVWHTLHL